MSAGFIDNAHVHSARVQRVIDDLHAVKADAVWLLSMIEKDHPPGSEWRADLINQYATMLGRIVCAITDLERVK